ncbi:MAG: hypothetical protein AB1649_26720, partial [Chloroflexota bacterium]
MSNSIAIRVENLSKRYPSTGLYRIEKKGVPVVRWLVTTSTGGQRREGQSTGSRISEDEITS